MGDEEKGTAMHEPAAKYGAHEISIVLNGTAVKVQKGSYSYEQLFTLAFPGETIPPGYDQPITYSRPHMHVEGHLLPGQPPIELHDGEVINVVSAHKS